MGDVGDYWREHKEHKRRVRNHWHECPHCAVAFGGNGTLVPPSEKCRNCSWVAPGTKGDDMRNAEMDRIRQEMEDEERTRKKAQNLKIRTCPNCSKIFKNQQAMLNHQKDKHQTKEQIND